MRTNVTRLMLVTNKGNKPLRQYLPIIMRCVKHGVTSVQLREKNMNLADVLAFGIALHRQLRPLGVPLIINDNIDLALQIGAEGVHLGQTDYCAIKARLHLGSDKIIGQSVNSMAQVHQANKLPIDYIGCSAIFPSRHKPKVSALWGLNGLTKVVASSVHPVMAIGGIRFDNVRAVMQAGAQGIAAIGAFHDVQDPGLATHQLLSHMEENDHDRQDPSSGENLRTTQPTGP